MSPRRTVAPGVAPQLEMLPGMEPLGPPAGEEAGRLTEEQEQAVARRAEPLLVSAAAGSGKTSVLVERFVRAVREDGLAPGRVLAITFTERAAGELRERVRARLLELGERQAARDTEAAYVGTFHGFCARLLRAHPLAAGLDRDFAVLEEPAAARLRRRAFQEAARGFLAEDRGEAADLLAAYGIDRVRAMLEQAYLELRSRGERLPRLPRPALGPAGEDEDEERELEAAGVCALLDELLERFGRAYERSKQSRAAVDFDDLELLAQLVLAEREPVRKAWSERFELLMVDEFQDTNPRQLAILAALDRRNLFTVGDELQSIYGFRHADVSLFRHRRAELEPVGGSLPLSRNFRSRAELLGVLNAIFAPRFERFAPLLAGREAAETTAGSADGDEPAVELLLTDSGGWEAQEGAAERIGAGLPASQPWRQAEARLLAERVAALVRSGRARPGEIAILLRASGDLEVFERALQLQGLRTLAAVGAFWGHQQIGDLVAYLRVLANPLDEEAVYGVLASPLARCSRDCLALLSRVSREVGIGVWEAARGIAGAGAPLPQAAAATAAHVGEGDRAALAGIVALIEAERAGAARRTISALVERAIEATGYREHVLSLDWGERRLANVHKLLRVARAFEAREGRSLRAFLDHVEFLRGEAAIEPDAPVEGGEPDAVRLMTVHAAKGLEFPVVCVADLGRLPNARTPDLLVEGSRLGVRLMRLDGERSAPALEYEALCAERREREAEEEDRILYVAMTRARELLLLSGSADFARWPRQGAGAAPLAWLGPAIDEELPGRLSGGEPVPGEVTLGSGGDARVRILLSSPRAPAFDLDGARQEQAPNAVPAEGPRAPAPSAAGAPAPVPPAHPPAARAGSRWPAPPSRPASEPRLAALSYSSLTELERCGYRYYLERELGLGEDRAAARALASGDEGLEARARGTLVHRLMELIDFADPRGPSASEVGDRARELGLRVGAGEREQLAALVAASLEGEPAARVAAASDVRREHPFAFSLGPDEPLISGVIDLLAREPDGSALVLDYKSDRVAPGGELEELVEREYGVQRLLYALAMLRDGAQAVEVVHWFLEPGEWVAVRFAAGERLVLEDRLAERIELARRRGFEVSGFPHRGLCLTCPGRAGLCSWSETETLREHP